MSKQIDFSPGRALRFFISTTLILMLVVSNVLVMLYKNSNKTVNVAANNESAQMDNGFETIEQENQRGKERTGAVIDWWNDIFNSVPAPDPRSFDETDGQRYQRQYEERRAEEREEQRQNGNVVPL